MYLKVLQWYLDLDGVKKNQIANHTSVTKCKNDYRCLNGIKKDDTTPTLVYIPSTYFTPSFIRGTKGPFIIHVVVHGCGFH